MQDPALISIVESVLFAHGEPVSVSKLAKTCGVRTAQVNEALADLEARYSDAASGLALIRSDGEVEVVTRPTNAHALESLFAAENDSPLGRAALEVLAIVAYRGPVSRSAIDAIRGVNSSFSLRSLLLRGLIDRNPNPSDAREYHYYPTHRFLEAVGMSSREALPDFEQLSRDPRLNPVAEPPSGGDEAGGREGSGIETNA